VSIFLSLSIFTSAFLEPQSAQMYLKHRLHLWILVSELKKSNVDTVIFKNFSQKENLTKQKDLSDKAGIYQQSSPCLSSC